MKTVTGAPNSRAAHATACPWLPALAVTTPRARCVARNVATRLTSPRTLKAPVRWRFSAFRKTSRPVIFENVSDPTTGVTCAWPTIRSRASRISASVGSVRVANFEHPLQYLPNGRQRIELPSLHVVEQPAELRVAGDRPLEMRLRTTGRDGERLTGPAPA